jgi:hypothetical protein
MNGGMELGGVECDGDNGDGGAEATVKAAENPCGGSGGNASFHSKGR